LLVAALSAGAGGEVLAEAMNDRLGEPALLAQMPETAAVHGEIRRAGLPVALGGRGPSLVIVVPRPEAPLRAEQIRRICRNRGTGWRVFVTEWEPDGAARA
jgi:homoserine kinase